MLIEFEVSNYRSIKDPAKLSLAAINYYKENKDQLIFDTLPGLSGVNYVRAAAVYGPNASGKSSIFQALSTMRDMVLSSSTKKASYRLPYDPFAFDEECKKKPTSFSVMFTAGGVRFQYEFSYVADKVLTESLFAYPKGRKQVWFTRSPSSNGDASSMDRVVCGSPYLGIPSAIVPLLNDNALLLSLLANYPKFEDSKTIQPIYKWFADDLMIIRRGPNENVRLPFSGEIVDGKTGSDYQRKFIQDMLRKADVGIVEAKIARRSMFEEVKAMGLKLGINEDDSEFRELLEGLDDANREIKTVVFSHLGQDKAVEFEIANESDGTQQLFVLSGYIARSIECGSTIFVDELDASIHPALVKEVINCFLDPKCNTKNAQLVFSAHNPCLLEDGFLRRDQIWLTEKKSGATVLYPISEFSPRKKESLMNGYLAGRYSATPVVPYCFGCAKE
ncbi:MAG TPA: ATP-binding protein [Candidatus Aphodovivens avicola]|nr:ATP-binding protein [Candidatus Aphodovivens avicola]